MKKSMIAIACVLNCGVAAHAADAKYHVGLGLFDSIPMSSDLKDYEKSSLGLNVSGDYNIDDMFAAGVEIGDAFAHDAKGLAKTYSHLKSFNTMSYGVRGKYVKHMDFGTKKGNVYGIVGIADYTSTTDPDTTTTSKIGFNFGVGAEVEVAPQWLVGLEVRYHIVKGNSIQANTLAPMISAGYTF
jgi:opacity protein-like surface antigen